MGRSAWEEVEQLCREYGVDRELLREYDLRPERAKIVGGALRLGTSREVLYIKRVAYGETRLLRVFSVVKQIASSGVRVSRFRPNKYGDPFVVTRQGNFYAQQHIAGTEPAFLTPDEFLQGIRALAEWHRFAKAPIGALLQMERIDLLQKWQMARAKIDTFREFALFREDATPMDELFLAMREDLLEQIEGCEKDLRNRDYQQVCLQAYESGEVCHGSFVRQNLLVTDLGLAVLDHDHMYQGTQILDLAAFLHRYAAKLSWDPLVCRESLALYGQIRPVSEREWEILHVLLLFPDGVVRLLETYYENRWPWLAQDALDALEQELEWDAARRVWIAELFGEKSGLSAEIPFSDRSNRALARVEHAALGRFVPLADGWGEDNEDRWRAVRLASRSAAAHMQAEPLIYRERWVGENTAGLWHPPTQS